MQKKNISDTTPNLIVWAWMRTVLGLSGTQLLIFSYLFTQSFDSVHACHTPLSEMEKWFGVARQTISRNIDTLVSNGFVYKATELDELNPMIKHNNYRVNMKQVTEMCEEADFPTYKNFIESYSFALKSAFPNDSGIIDSYLNGMLEWHKKKNIKLCITLGELACELGGMDVSEISLSDVFNRLAENRNTNYVDPFRSHSEKSDKPKKQNKVESKKANNKLFDEPKKSGRVKRNEWDAVKRDMNKSFIVMNAYNNEELLNLLNSFLDTQNGRSYTPAQWQNQLDNLYTHGRTLDRMIEGVRKSYMNNYRSLYLVDRSEVDIPVKLAEIDAYICQEGNDCSQELKKWLSAYVTEVPKGKSCTVNQFRLMLEDLSDICKTLNDRVESVKRSYVNSYASLAYRPATAQQDDSVDMEEKEILVHKFIVDGYYQLCDGLEDALLTYIHETKVGKSMTKPMFSAALNNLRLFCMNDDMLVDSVTNSIQNNKPYLIVENYNETKKLKAKCITLESFAKFNEDRRRQDVEDAKRKNPNDSRFKDVDFNKPWT